MNCWKKDYLQYSNVLFVFWYFLRVFDQGKLLFSGIVESKIFYFYVAIHC